MSSPSLLSESIPVLCTVCNSKLCTSGLSACVHALCNMHENLGISVMECLVIIKLSIQSLSSENPVFQGEISTSLKNFQETVNGVYLAGQA